MDLYEQGSQKYGAADVVQSAASCNWSGIAAELRDHPEGELPPFDIAQTELCIATACRKGAVVTRRGGGIEQSTTVIPGAIWTCPAKIREEEIRIREWHQTLHIYLPSSRFIELSDLRGGAVIHDHQVRYLAGLHDGLIRQIAWTLLEELRAPTPAGRVLAETLALTLTARLTQLYADHSRGGEDPTVTPHHLDDRRLSRVLEFMAQNLEVEVSVDDIAGVACLSPFHFTRMFRNRMGVPPHRYLANMRIELAKTLLSDGKVSISEIALRTCFSSQANFTRAFHRSVGSTPRDYQKNFR